MTVPLNVYRNGQEKILLTTPMQSLSKASTFNLYYSAAEAGPYTFYKSFPNAIDPCTPRSALVIAVRSELGFTPKDTIYFRATAVKNASETPVLSSPPTSVQPIQAANYDTFSEAAWTEPRQMLGFDPTDSIWRRIQVDDDGRLVVTGLSGGGGSGDASSANQLIQIDLAQQQLQKLCDILDALGGVMGSATQFIESLPVSTLSGDSWVEKLSLTTTDLTTGTYLVQWSYQWNLDSTTRNFEARVQLNDSSIWEHVQEPKDSGGNFSNTGSDQKHALSFAKVLDLSGVNIIDLDWRSPPGSSIEASIWEARIILWRLV